MWLQRRILLSGVRGAGGGADGRRGSEACQSVPERHSRLDDAVKVVGFGVAGGAFDGDDRERAELGDDKQDACKCVGADAGFVPPMIPVVAA